MSLHQQVLVYCDNDHDVRCPFHGECASNERHEHPGSATVARAWMKRQGWVRRNGRDLCSTCKDLNQQKVAD